MSTAVLISIQPKWCELIASGKKTVEVRKSRPKIETPFKCYFYCTKSKGEALWKYRGEYYYDTQFPNERPNKANGKVIGEFMCNGFTYIEAGYDTNGNKHLYNTAFIEHCMCIPDNDLHKYLYKSRENSGGWAWHISNLKIYDKPKELGDFQKHGALSYDDWLYGIYNGTTTSVYEDYLKPFKVIYAPQSWCYVEELKI